MVESQSDLGVKKRKTLLINEGKWRSVATPPQSRTGATLSQEIPTPQHACFALLLLKASFAPLRHHTKGGSHGAAYGEKGRSATTGAKNKLQKGTRPEKVVHKIRKELE